MNIAFFLIPKNEVAYIQYESTMRQALEKMEFHQYSAVPLLDDRGRYVGTLTEGDLLWKIKRTPGLTFTDSSKVFIKDIELHRNNTPISIDAEMEDIVTKAMEQNFVPVIDDNNIFIGIITRRDIINFLS